MSAINTNRASSSRTVGQPPRYVAPEYKEVTVKEDRVARQGGEWQLSHVSARILFALPKTNDPRTAQVRFSVDGAAQDVVVDARRISEGGGVEVYEASSPTLAAVGWRRGIHGGPNGDQPSNSIYPLFGPPSRTTADITALAANATVPPVRFQVVTDEGGERGEATQRAATLTPFATPPYEAPPHRLGPDEKLKGKRDLVEIAIVDRGEAPLSSRQGEHDYEVHGFVPRDRYDQATRPGYDNLYYRSPDLGRMPGSDVWPTVTLPNVFALRIARATGAEETIDVFASTTRGIPGHPYTVEVHTDADRGREIHYLNNPGDDPALP